MSKIYDEYIENHKKNVFNAFLWLEANLPEVFHYDEFKAECRYLCEFSHDESKYSDEEYDAYDKYFYGNRSYEVVENFRKAWLHHIHANPHHWQHWVLINDNPEEGEIVLDIPNKYIIEMICDWMSFSLSKGNLYELFDWYDEHKKYMKLSDLTRDHVEDILTMIKNKLTEMKDE